MILPELSQLDLNSPRSVLRIDGNPLDQDLVDQLKLGISHVLDYIRTDQYQSYVLMVVSKAYQLIVD